jgi:hypothetical protein
MTLQCILDQSTDGGAVELEPQLKLRRRVHLHSPSRNTSILTFIRITRPQCYILEVISFLTDNLVK